MLSRRTFLTSVECHAVLKLGNPYKRPQSKSDSDIPGTQQAFIVCMCVCMVAAGWRLHSIWHDSHNVTNNKPHGTHSSITCAHIHVPKLKKRCMHINTLMYSHTKKHTVLHTVYTLTKQKPLPSHPIRFLCGNMLTLCSGIIHLLWKTGAADN